MCLSKVYVDSELLIEEIAFVKVEGEKLLLKTLFGEQKEIEASIVEIDFLSHSILLGNLKNKAFR
jgi:predicted RNA-binding protein|tara:strand:- start:1379 stop:1573 length:195 start_codon:yes stop_codon:yes gene_type:complete